ncbi:MAG: hypothetical protein DYG89_14000 [Caldilinea sp. CFX5]|nr:hypothetical protein [Caldilinea sp. CFX5]
MLNYDATVTQAKERQSLLLGEAEQWHLAQSLAPSQPHPIFAWVGRRLIRWGEQLQSEGQTPVLPTSRAIFTR